MAYKADLLLATATCAVLMAWPALGQDRGITYTLYGTPGLIDMPTAMAANDGDVGTTIGWFDGQQRNTFTFQITPRLSGSFRYSSVRDFQGPGEGGYFDRSFDLRYQFIDESDWLPAIAVGLQDFLGTGLYSAEYLVASKTLSDSVRITAGLGWGRLGSYNGFTNPLGVIDSSLETRPALDFGLGGTISANQLFRGDAAIFGGIEWSITDRLTFKAEYSSDAYSAEASRGLFQANSPLNFGLTWKPKPNYQVGLSFVGGSEIAFTGTIILNPSVRPFSSGLEPPPVPVSVRAAGAAAAQSWDLSASGQADLRGRLQQELAREGVELNAVEITADQVRLRYTNTRYRTEAQAMGRIARILTGIMPASVELFRLEPMQAGIPLSSSTFRRSDIETLENAAGGSALSQQRSILADAGGAQGLVTVPPVGDTFTWGISPYLAFFVFDGDKPVNFDAGLSVTAEYRIQPNLIISGRLRQSLVGSNDVGSISPSTLPPVRRYIGYYNVQGNPGIENLTLAYYARPAPDIYARVTVGYLERMFGGVSAEVLWKPVDSDFAVGFELNQVMQRDFDMLLGFQDYQVTTGHASVYYDFQNGFHGQLDVGRYLAGDWGATVSIDREFQNGWKIGGYFTLTDVPFEDFGEGSFDKGIRLTIPFDYILGQPSRREIANTLSSLTRDGGARLVVDGRLYETIRGGHFNDLSDSWGRFWR